MVNGGSRNFDVLGKHSVIEKSCFKARERNGFT